MWRDPYEEMKELERRMNRMFREFWGRGPRRRGLVLPGAREPYSDIMEAEDSVVVTAELPGVGKEDININATEEGIEISAEVRRDEKVEEKDYYRRERGYSRYYRSYPLPARVKPDRAKATYKNGVLEVVLPKAEGEERGRSIKID